MNGKQLAANGKLPQPVAALCGTGKCFGDKRRAKNFHKRFIGGTDGWTLNGHGVNFDHRGQPLISDPDWCRDFHADNGLVHEDQPVSGLNAKGHHREMAAKGHLKELKFRRPCNAEGIQEFQLNEVTMHQPRPDKHKEFRRQRETIRGHAN